MEKTKISLLVVEDEDALRSLLVDIYSDEGYAVDSAVNGREAWALMEKNSYDILLTDMFMPEMNGIELLERSLKEFPETKTILCSGGGQEIEAQHNQKVVKYNNRSIEIDLFLEKPCDLQTMILAVENLSQ